MATNHWQLRSPNHTRAHPHSQMHHHARLHNLARSLRQAPPRCAASLAAQLLPAARCRTLSAAAAATAMPAVPASLGSWASVRDRLYRVDACALCDASGAGVAPLFFHLGSSECCSDGFNGRGASEAYTHCSVRGAVRGAVAIASRGRD